MVTDESEAPAANAVRSNKRRKIMTMTISQCWFADAIGGVATAVLAIIGLSGAHAEMMTAIATIVFGAALLIEGGTMLSEYAHIIFPPGLAASGSYEFQRRQPLRRVYPKIAPQRLSCVTLTPGNVARIFANRT
jgi:hypothetical protein